MGGGERVGETKMWLLFLIPPSGPSICKSWSEETALGRAVGRAEAVWGPVTSLVVHRGN